MKEYKKDDLFIFPYCDGEKIEYRICVMLGKNRVVQSYYNDFVGKGGKAEFLYEVYDVLFHEGILERRVSGGSSLGISVEVIFGKEYFLHDGSVRGFNNFIPVHFSKDTYTEEDLKKIEALVNSAVIIPEWLQESDRRYFVNKGILLDESAKKNI